MLIKKYFESEDDFHPFTILVYVYVYIPETQNVLIWPWSVKCNWAFSEQILISGCFFSIKIHSEHYGLIVTIVRMVLK